MMRGDDVLNATFTPTQFSEGYDERQVDDFLDAAAAALRHHEVRSGGDAGMTSSQVRDVRFTPTRFRRGYEMHAVDDVLERVAAALAEHEGVTNDAAPRREAPPAPARSAPTSATSESRGSRLLRLLRGDPKR